MLKVPSTHVKIHTWTASHEEYDAPPPTEVHIVIEDRAFTDKIAIVIHSQEECDRIISQLELAYRRVFHNVDNEH